MLPTWLPAGWPFARMSARTSSACRLLVGAQTAIGREPALSGASLLRHEHKRHIQTFQAAKLLRSRMTCWASDPLDPQMALEFSSTVKTRCASCFFHMLADSSYTPCSKGKEKSLGLSYTVRFPLCLFLFPLSPAFLLKPGIDSEGSEVEPADWAQSGQAWARSP